MMELTRREQLVGLIGTATGVSSALYVFNKPALPRSDLSTSDIETMRATAEVVYPSDVDVSSEFIENYMDRMCRARMQETKRVITDLDRKSRGVFGKNFAAISPVNRDTLLRHLGVNRVQPRVTGTLAGRIRFHLVNSLLYALFTHPKGSELYGIDNPVGYPGGFENLLDDDADRQ